MMGVTDCDGQGIGRIGPIDRRSRQQPADHHYNLGLLGASCANDCQLYGLGSIFGDWQSGQSRCQ